MNKREIVDNRGRTKKAPGTIERGDIVKPIEIAR